MSYIDWVESHSLKHKKIVSKLENKSYTKEQIVDYFDYENMRDKEVDFCPLYIENRKCHDMKELNCYLCACPNFRFNDAGISEYNGFKIVSRCDIHNGKEFASSGVIHQDCSSCSVPHHKSYILKNFDLNWKKIMQKCQL